MIQKNRSVIIEGLEQDIREENIIVKDPFFVQEAPTFIYDGLGDVYKRQVEILYLTISK